MRAAPRGMTLLELMTVVALIGVLAALAGSSFQASIDRGRDNDQVSALYGQTLTARKLARSTNQPVRIALTTDPDGGIAARYERLPCDNETFGIGCPSSGCNNTTACGTVTCPCREVGNTLQIRPSVDVSALGGLCFLGGSGQAVLRNGSSDCIGAPIAGPTALRVAVTHQANRYLVLEPVTGLPRMVDCGLAGTSMGAGICP